MFDPTEKNLLIGAFATAGIDLAFEAYFNYVKGSGKPIEGFPYGRLHPVLPPNDDLIANAGFPLLLYILGKTMKKPSLVTMAKGGMVYGGSELIGETVYEAIHQYYYPTARYVPLR